MDAARLQRVTTSRFSSCSSWFSRSSGFNSGYVFFDSFSGLLKEFPILFYVLVNSFPEVDFCPPLRRRFWRSVHAHGYLDTISTRSLYLAVTFAVIGLSFLSWCNDSVYGPDSGMRRNPWSFCKCSSWTWLRRPSSFNDRCAGPGNAEICGVSTGAVLGQCCCLPVVVQDKRLVQTAQNVVEFP